MVCFFHLIQVAEIGLTVIGFISRRKHMKLKIKKQSLKQLSNKSLNNDQTLQIGAGRFTPDPGSWVICNTHPAHCLSKQIGGACYTGIDGDAYCKH